jgi:hypothetical protein
MRHAAITAKEGMMRLRVLVLVTLVAAMGVGVCVPPASANHKGATIDCGSAGTFTIKAQQTPAQGGIQAPFPHTVILFEEGGLVTVFEFVVDGQVVFNNAETGQETNNVNEVTCTFTLDGRVIEVTGILTPP